MLAMCARAHRNRSTQFPPAHGPWSRFWSTPFGPTSRTGIAACSAVSRQHVKGNARQVGAPEPTTGQLRVASAAQIVVELRRRTRSRHDQKDISDGAEQRGGTSLPPRPLGSIRACDVISAQPGITCSKAIIFCDRGRRPRGSP